MTGRDVLLLQEKLADEYKYKPLPPLFSMEYRRVYEENIPEYLNIGGDSKSLYTPGGILLSNGYARIVIGDYGAFVEITPEQIARENLVVESGQEYRISDPKYSERVKYHWLTVKGDNTHPKVYFQQKTVSYADYLPQMYYISPFEVTVK